MRTKVLKLAVVALFISLAANSQEKITLTGTKFTLPLVQKWATEYQKVNPNAQIQVLSKTAVGQNVDISIIAHQPTATTLNENQKIVYVNKYALLPVSNPSNAYLKSVKKRGLNKKELSKLFFIEDDLEETKPEKEKFALDIYAREGQSCSAIAFSNYFGSTPAKIKGKKIAGDDIYLLSAVKKDTIGITYANLGYLFDIQSRQIKDGLTIIPLDLDKNAFATINKSVDDAIAVLEKSSFETIPVEKVGLIINSKPTNNEVEKFVEWVLSDGQKYNHEYGFLNLDRDLLADETQKLTERVLTSK